MGRGSGRSYFDIRKTESIDALIAELQDVKAMMDGRYPFEKGRVRADEMDFDAFLHT